MPTRRLLLATLVLLSAPGSASAGTVSMREDPPSKYDSGATHLTFTADPGERNDVALARDGADVLLRDSGAPLTPGATCAALDANTVRCHSLYTIVSIDVDLADSGDTYMAGPGAGARVLGGDGADTITGPGTLTGGAGNDVLTGSAEQDTLNGGPGDDVLHGLGGDDQLSGDGVGGTAADPAAGDDVLDGGDGTDTVSYAGRTVAVRVDLADPAPDGQAGEHDTLTSIEGADGGHGDDVLAGDAGPNRLLGADGSDVLRGRGGDDDLDDGGGIGSGDPEGADTLYGGDGDDTLTANGKADRAFGEAGNDGLIGGAGAVLDGGAGDDAFGVGLGRSYTPVVCGPGHDSLAGAPRKGERVGSDCEDIHLSPFEPFTIAVAPARRPGGVYSLPVRCNKLPPITPDCHGRVTLLLRRPGHRALVLGARSFVLAPLSAGFVRVQLHRAGRRALAHARKPLLELQLAFNPPKGKLPAPGGHAATASASGRWTVRLP